MKIFNLKTVLVFIFFMSAVHFSMAQEAVPVVKERAAKVQRANDDASNVKLQTGQKVSNTKQNSATQSQQATLQLASPMPDPKNKIATGKREEAQPKPAVTPETKAAEGSGDLKR